jgi:hypothetical protein
VLPAEASEHLGEAQGGDGLLPLSLCGSAWTCIGRQKCRIDISEARLTLILLAMHLRLNLSCLHSKIFAKSMDKI